MGLEKGIMPGQSTWPPPPAVPHPLAEHDGFLTACVLRSSAKQPVTRLSLVRNLCKERGTDLRQSLAIVNNYCDRHLILPPARGLAAWGASLASLVMIAVVVIMEAVLWMLRRDRNASVTPMERLTINNEVINLALVFMGIIVVLGCIQVAFILRTGKERRRDAEDARKKPAG